MAVSSANTSQKALCVIKLSLLQTNKQTNNKNPIHKLLVNNIQTNFSLSFCKKKCKPRKESSTIASILLTTANLGMSFPIRLNSVTLGALLALIFLLAVFPTKVFLDPSEITKGTRRVVMNAARDRTNVDFLPHFFARSLSKLPG